MTFTLPVTDNVVERSAFEAAMDSIIGSVVSAVSVGYPPYADTTAGLAATDDGDGFSVFGASGFTLYLNDGGAASALGTYPLSTVTDAISAKQPDWVYATPAAVKASTDSLTEGQTIQTKTGFHYTVAASGATDHHLTTAGGDKLYVGRVGGAWHFDAWAPNNDGSTSDLALFQSANDAIEARGGGVIYVTDGGDGYLIDGVFSPGDKVRWVGIESLSQRGSGGGTLRGVRLIPGHAGVIVKLGASGDQSNLCEFSGFAVYADPGDAFYQQFTPFQIADFRHGRMRNLFAGGGALGFDWTGVYVGASGNSATQYVITENMAADDCLGPGVQIDLPTPANEAAPFMQACTLGVGSITNCAKGIHIGGGQMIGNRIIFEGGQCGGHSSFGLHMDGDETDKGAPRAQFTIEGAPWFENSNPGGPEVQVDCGTLIIACQMNTGRIATSGKGRVVSWVGHAHHDFMIPVTGFPVSGLQRAWSFRDIGSDTFHCPISGVAAEKTGSGTKSTDATETKFRSGIKGDGAGGGWTVNDVTFDWTADWTVAFLAYNTTNGNHLAFTIEDSVSTSSLDLSPRPAYLRLRTQDNGGVVDSKDLGGMNSSYLDAPQWFVLSYDASATLFTVYGPNGTVLNTYTQAVPAALSASGYTDWLLNGGQNSTVILDELAVWDRVLDGDEVLQVCNLNVDLHSAIGHDPRQGYPGEVPDKTAYRVGGTQVVGAQQAAITDLGVTASSGTLPTPDGSLTIADAASPTNAELLEYSAELEAKFEAVLAALRAHGLIAT